MVALFALLAFLAGCSMPPDQPDLNTYGAVQPLCLLGCRITFTLTEGDAAVSPVGSTVTETDTRNVNK